MARLRSGSSDSMRRKLFPKGFAGEVMQLLWKIWRSFSLDSSVHLETQITAIFHSHLIDAYEAEDRSWFIVPEYPVTDNKSGKELGRNDLRFYPLSHHGQAIFFAVECKRLRVTTPSGFAHLADEYAKEGVGRFVDGKYASKLPCGGMVGYVMDNDVSKAFVSVKSKIESGRKDLKLLSRNYFCTPSACLPDYQWSADTYHSRRDGKFAIHHLLLGVKR